MREIQTRLLPPGGIEEARLNYVVMAARYQDMWLFVRHRDRDSWEMVSGHIEEGESSEQAARRELTEEAGVQKASLKLLCDYEVEVNEKVECGRFYAVKVHELDPLLKHEIEEIVLAERLPDSLTYPEVHSALFQRAVEHFGLS